MLFFKRIVTCFAISLFFAPIVQAGTYPSDKVLKKRLMAAYEKGLSPHFCYDFEPVGKCRSQCEWGSPAELGQMTCSEECDYKPTPFAEGTIWEINGHMKRCSLPMTGAVSSKNPVYWERTT